MYYYTFLVTFLSINLYLSAYGEEQWIEPNAWGRHVKQPAGILIDSHSNLPNCEESYKLRNNNEIISHIYYKKLIGNLFNRSKLKYDKLSSQYIRSVTFAMSLDDLNKLEKSNDAREIDVILSKILETSKTFYYESDSENDNDSSLFFQLKHILNDIYHLTKSIEMRFTLLALLCTMLIWFLHQRFNKNIFGMLLISAFSIGYLCTYYDCNRKLETEEYIKILKSEPDPHPNSNWLHIFPFNLFQETPKQKQINELRESSKIKWPFCRPDAVFFMYINEVFVNQLEFFIDKCVQMAYKFQHDLPFPFNYISVCIIPFLAVFILKLLFKYIISPRLWIGYFYNHNSHHHRPGNMNYVPISQDQISGDNLKLLLNALKPTFINTTFAQINTSAVEELTETTKSEIIKNVNDGSKEIKNDLLVEGEIKEIIEKSISNLSSIEPSEKNAIENMQQ